LYKNKENEIKEYIKNNFSELIFLVDFPEDSISNECGIGNIIDINVNPPIDISYILLDREIFDTNQGLIKFKLKAKVKYTARVYYMKYLNINKLEKDFVNSIEVNIEVMFTLMKNNSFSNPIIKMEPTNAALNFE
jgi:hypothetical protein